MRCLQGYFVGGYLEGPHGHMGVNCLIIPNLVVANISVVCRPRHWTMSIYPIPLTFKQSFSLLIYLSICFLLGYTCMEVGSVCMHLVGFGSVHRLKMSAHPGLHAANVP